MKRSTPPLLKVSGHESNLLALVIRHPGGRWIHLVHVHDYLGKHVKKTIATVVFYLATLLISGAASLQYILEHEDGHDEKAAGYGLNPKIDYLGRRTHYDEVQGDRLLDIIGAGATREQEIKYDLSQLHIPNDPYPLYTVYMFNHGSEDGNEYHLMTNDEFRDEIKQAIIIEPFIIAAQWFLLLNDSPFFIHSRTEIDRRGVLSFWEISYKREF